MKTIFTISVAVNLLLLGCVIGMFVHSYSEHPWHETRKEFEPETRHLFARAFQKTHREIEPFVKKARKTQKSLIETIAAEEFNNKKYKQLTKEMIDLQKKIATEKADGMLDLIQTLSDEDRKKFSRHFAGAIAREGPPKRGRKR